MYVESQKVQTMFGNMWTTFENGVGKAIALGDIFVNSSFYKNISSLANKIITPVDLIKGFSNYSAKGWIDAADLIIKSNPIAPAEMTNEEKAKAAIDKIMADAANGEGAGVDKPYDSNLKSLKEKSESDKVDAMDLAGKLIIMVRRQINLRAVPFLMVTIPCLPKIKLPQ